MNRKTTYSKKQIEQQLMLQIRQDLLLCAAGIPESFKPRIKSRIDVGIKTLEDHISIHHPSEWFRMMFTRSMAYYAGFCWFAKLEGSMWKVQILDALPEHKVVAE